MAKAELGDKQLCPNCGAKFYDLRKRPAVCPKCATTFDPSDETVRVKRARARTGPVGKGYDDEEEEEVVTAAADEEEEVEETAELDGDGAAEVLVADEDDDAAPESDLPPGFSEDEGEDLEDEGVSEEDIPTLEDDEEFDEDELGIGGDDDDDA